MSRFPLRTLILLIFTLLFTPVIIFGQNTDELCQAFINRAFGDMGSNCANLATGEACYAYGNFGEVTTTFYVDGTSQVVRDDVFTAPAERIMLLQKDELTTVESISAADFSLGSTEEESRWGLATINVVANLPEASAVFVLYGGARLENAVYPDDAVVLPETPVTVSSDSEISVYGSPEGAGYLVPDVVVGRSTGELLADAQSPDGEWLRVYFTYERSFGERTTAWVKVADLSSTEGIESLPVFGPDDYTPMQHFYLTNSSNHPECAQVPAPGLLIQGPGEIETDLVINDLPVRLTSTAYFRLTSENRLQVIALTGFVALFPDSANETIIPEGFTRTVCLLEAQDLGIDGQANDLAFDNNCPDAETRPLTGADLAGLTAFEDVPSNLLNYQIAVPSEICPSGVGNVQCILVPASPIRIEEKCEAGLLPEDVCAVYGY